MFLRNYNILNVKCEHNYDNENYIHVIVKMVGTKSVSFYKMLLDMCEIGICFCENW